MKCPFCGHLEDRVIDSREAKIGDTIRRRRECARCERRFTTYERIDEVPHMVVKKDGRREKFDRQKLMAGLMKACERRPIAPNRLEQIVNDVEGYVAESADRERPSSEIGEMVMKGLKKLDKVAYVRFASVYLDFKDVREFMDELKDLLRARNKAEA
jgi:transcriptional repressor NrdR